MSNADFHPYGISTEEYNKIVDHLTQQTKPIHLLIQNLTLQGINFRDAHRIVNQIQIDLDNRNKHTPQPQHKVEESSSNLINQHEWVAHHDISWMTPFSISECSRRLLALRKKYSFFIWNTNRTIVEIAVLNKFHRKFILRRIAKNNWQDGWALFAITGDLVYQGSNITQVSYSVEWNRILFGFYILLFSPFAIAIFDWDNILSSFVFVAFYLATISFPVIWTGISTFNRLEELKNQLLLTLEV